jgi:hypothetical protein
VALALNLGACLWSGHPLWAGLAFPIRQALWAYILWRSARRYKKKGVVWRGRRYRPGS